MKATDIKKASKQQKEDGLVAYITYVTDVAGRESLVSNFYSGKITDNELIKFVKAGLLEQDWDTYIVK